MANIGKILVEALAVAIVYIATAQLGFVVAIAPGNVTVVWPPSGIALAAMLLLGYRAWAGVWLGSFLVNALFFFFHNTLLTITVVTASSIAAGSTLQALLAAFLYRRMISLDIPHNPKGIFRFITLATVSCFVAATVGASSLAFSRAIAWTDYTATWFTWWLGDLVGILTVAPVLLTVGYRVRQSQGTKYLAFPLVNGGIGLSLLAAYNIWNHGNPAYLGVSEIGAVPMDGLAWLNFHRNLLAAPAWLSWVVFANGLLLAVLLASYIEHYLGIEAALRESEQQLRDSVAKTRAMLETAVDGIITFDPQGTILTANPAAERIFGYGVVDEMVGHKVSMLMPDPYRSAHKGYLERYLTIGERRIIGIGREVQGLRKDGLVFPMELSVGEAVIGATRIFTGIVRDITLLKRTEGDLRAILDHSPALISIKDVKGDIRLASRSYGVLDGPAFERLVGMNVLDVYPPEMAESIWQSDLEALASGEPVESEETLRHRDGTLHTYLAIRFPVYRDDEPFGICVIRTDITQRKAAEAALSESRLRIRALLDASPDEILLVATDGTILDINKAAERRMAPRACGTTAIGQTLQALLPGELAEARLRAINEVAESGAPSHLEERLGERWLDLLIFPVLRPDQPITEVACYARDFTQRRNAEAELRKLNQALHQSPVSVVITDPLGNIEYVNPKFTESTGYCADEVFGQNPRILKPGHKSSEEYDVLWRTIAGGQVWRGELQSRRKDGTLFWELASIAPVKDDEGRVTHFIALKEDITQDKAIEQQLRQTQQLRALGQLTGGIAHDFNNLLAIIVGNLELLADRAKLDGSDSELMADALWAAQRGGELTHRLLAFARRQPLNPAITDLNEVVRGISDLLRRTLGTGIEVRERLAPDLWLAYIDSVELERAVINLAVNARDAIGTTGTLTIETRNVFLGEEFAEHYQEVAPGEYAWISVADTGSGMSPEVMKRVFEPFFTTKEFGKGSGLGLSMVYGFAKQSGGHVGICSELDKGTTVNLYLPRAGEEVDGVNGSSTAMPNGLSDVAILAVEDEDRLRTVLVKMPQNLGLVVFSADDGGVALARLAQQKVVHQSAVRRRHQWHPPRRWGAAASSRCADPVHHRLCRGVVPRRAAVVRGGMDRSPIRRRNSGGPPPVCSPPKAGRRRASPT